MRTRELVCLLLVASSTGLLAGCQTPARLRAPERFQQGVVFVLPGIEGRSMLNRNIALGLDEAGVRSAIEVYDWTIAPGTFVANLGSYERNRRKAQELADRIIAYRDKHPGNPVHLIGHSGGGGIAIMVLEALPPGRQIDMAILLAPAISPEYDLRTALRRTTRGILNCFSEKDISLLKLGTTVFGRIDGDRGPAAGAVGFRPPPGLSRSELALYNVRLKQVQWTRRLQDFGASGSHLGWASRDFARNYLARFVIAHENARAGRVSGPQEQWSVADDAAIEEPPAVD